MNFNHVSVLLRETVEKLNVKADGVYVDGTLGGGGHSSAICDRLSSKGTLIGIDRDKDALLAAKERLIGKECNKIYVNANYADIKDVLRDKGISEIDGAILDLGVSSFQLDNGNRGFSYMIDAPLDMRMNREDVLTAYHVVNEYSKEKLISIIKDYGEEKWAVRIASFICEERKLAPIKSTYKLVDVIKAAIPAKARRDGPHPAKRTFQAIRIEVNDELGKLREAVEDFCDVLKPGGRLCVISFHSLEDRIVKDIISRRVNPCICPAEFPVCVCGKVADIKKITGKPIVPSQEELEENPRSRSAKLRVCEKI